MYAGFLDVRWRCFSVVVRRLFAAAGETQQLISGWGAYRDNLTGIIIPVGKFL
jgi:hypothetical protein